jgi:hypothetical protein
MLPKRLILFDEPLARQVRDALADPRVELHISDPFPPFEQLFDELMQTLAPTGEPELDLPDHTIAALCAACARLWDEKPWLYSYDHPLIEIRPGVSGRKVVPAPVPAEPLYASILGANREVFGVAFYTDMADFDRDSQRGMLQQLAVETLGLSDDEADLLAYGVDDAAVERVFLVSFDPRDELHPDYLAQLERNGWPRKHDMAPTFMARGGADNNANLSAEEADRVAFTLDALMTFCERHEDEITDEQPASDTVSVVWSGQEVPVAVAVRPRSGASARRARNRRDERTSPCPSASSRVPPLHHNGEGARG